MLCSEVAKSWRWRNLFPGPAAHPASTALPERIGLAGPCLSATHGIWAVTWPVAAAKPAARGLPASSFSRQT